MPTSATTDATMPVIYIPHGGGPLPLLGDPAHAPLCRFLQALPGQLPRPASILLVSAHWEEDRPTVMTAASPGMLYDYYGFPDEAYTYRYPAPGNPVLAEKTFKLLEQAGLQPGRDSERGFDHGCFVPLMLMYPDADIPVVQLSLCRNLDPALHIRVGEAIAALAGEGVLILGSGFSFHNMRFVPDAPSIEKARQFDEWLNASLLDSKEAGESRRALEHWLQAPHARYAHPREEHLLPLHVCLGAALANGYAAGSLFEQAIFQIKVSGFIWKNAAA